MFPILFALILGRATHTVLRWRLERSERISVLDTLAASTSLTSTVVFQFQVRAISLFGIILMSIWALSPIGGQALLRQMSIGVKNTPQPAIFSYLVHNGYNTGFLNTGRVTLWQIVNSIFLSAVISSTVARSSPRDNWGNVKIPMIEHYESRLASDSDGWFDATGGTAGSYTSMVGIPMAGITSSDYVNYHTRIQTSYLQMICSLTPTTLINIDNRTLTQSGMTQFWGPSALIYVSTEALAQRRNSDPRLLSPLKFQYLTRIWGENKYRLNCTLLSSYVKTQINYPLSTTCMATKVRRSRFEAPPPAWTLLDMPVIESGVLFTQILDSGRGKNQTPTAIDKYMSNPDLVIRPGDESIIAADGLPYTTKENYSIRLTQLFNSYFTIMNGMYTIAVGLDDRTGYFWDRNMTFVPQKFPDPSAPYPRWSWFDLLDDGKLTGKAWRAEGTRQTSKEVIIAHLPWVITLCVSSVVLTIASFVSPLVHFFLIKGPEVMMNISSLATRHNPYIPLPEGGTYLGASVRARLLKSLEVRFGDFEKDSSGSHLAIGVPSGTDGRSIARIRKGRLYE